MIFLYEQIEQQRKQGMRIIRVFGRGGRAELPEEIQGKPVTELGAYAFSDRMDRQELAALMSQGKLCYEDGANADPAENLPEMAGENLLEVKLPETLTKIGRYAFYNCGHLRKIEFGSALNDIGAGALTGCHKVERLRAEVQSDGTSCLKELLTELPEELRVDLRKNDEEGRFWFPEFFEEGVENTPARILENHVHGSGIRYRNCFIHKSLNIKEYDKLFSYAKAWEQEKTVTSLAMDRILYPMELSRRAKERYLDHLREHLGMTVFLLAGRKEYGSLGRILEELLPCREEIDKILDMAEQKGDTECVSLLMDYLHRHTKKQRRVFEL